MASADVASPIFISSSSPPVPASPSRFAPVRYTSPTFFSSPSRFALVAPPKRHTPTSSSARLGSRAVPIPEGAETGFCTAGAYVRAHGLGSSSQVAKSVPATLEDEIVDAEDADPDPDPGRAGEVAATDEDEKRRDRPTSGARSNRVGSRRRKIFVYPAARVSPLILPMASDPPSPILPTPRSIEAELSISPDTGMIRCTEEIPCTAESCDEIPMEPADAMPVAGILVTDGSPPAKRLRLSGDDDLVCDMQPQEHALKEAELPLTERKEGRIEEDDQLSPANTEIEKKAATNAREPIINGQDEPALPKKKTKKPPKKALTITAKAIAHLKEPELLVQQFGQGPKGQCDDEIAQDGCKLLDPGDRSDYQTEDQSQSHLQTLDKEIPRNRVSTNDAGLDAPGATNGDGPETASGKSAPKKRAAAPKKARKAPVKKKQAALPPPRLPSPVSAQRTIAAQPVVFGTSSQLAEELEEPSGYLHDLQRALKLSEETARLEGVPSQTMAASPTMARFMCKDSKIARVATGRCLWTAGDRDGEGNCLIPDAPPATPEHLRNLRPATPPARRERDSERNVSVGRRPVATGYRPEASGVLIARLAISTASRRPRLQHSAGSASPAHNPLQQVSPNVAKLARPLSTAAKAKAKSARTSTSTSPSKMVFENGVPEDFPIGETEGLGEQEQPMKRRQQKKTKPKTPGESVSADSEAPRPRKRASKAKTLAPEAAEAAGKVGQEAGQWEHIDDVPVSSPVRRHHRADAEERAHLDEIDDSTAEPGSEGQLQTIVAGAKADTGTPGHSLLFEQITRAITTAPRSTDGKNPSWHEKMLLYDPIVLEDLAAWLNSGPLGEAGPVEPALVQKWCESKSVCCLWKEGLRQRARKA